MRARFSSTGQIGTIHCNYHRANIPIFVATVRKPFNSDAYSLRPPSSFSVPWVPFLVHVVSETAGNDILDFHATRNSSMMAVSRHTAVSVLSSVSAHLFVFFYAHLCKNRKLSPSF